jgi:small-conductance mechanosensitive channel
LPTKILNPSFWTEEGRQFAHDVLHSLGQVTLVIVGWVVLRRILYRLIDGLLAHLVARETRAGKTEEHAGRLQTLQGLVKSLISYILFFVFGVLLLNAVGFNIMPFITTAGVLGLAIGFGSQKLVKDVISGFFIIVDDLFVVGDTVTIGTVTGQVIEMGMRVTRMRDSAGRLYLLSNGDIGTVTNYSRFPVTDFVEVTVAAGADLKRVEEIVNQTGTNLMEADESRLKAAPALLGVTAFTATSLTVRISVVAVDPRQLIVEQMRVRSALRAALLAAEIPLA